MIWRRLLPEEVLNTANVLDFRTLSGDEDWLLPFRPEISEAIGGSNRPYFIIWPDQSKGFGAIPSEEPDRSLKILAIYCKARAVLEHLTMTESLGTSVLN